MFFLYVLWALASCSGERSVARVQSGSALPATQKDLSTPIIPWLPTKRSFWLVSVTYASEQLGHTNAFGLLSKDSGLASVNAAWGGLVTGSAGPTEEEQRGRRRRGAQVGNKLSLQAGRPLGLQACCPPAQPSARRLPGRSGLHAGMPRRYFSSTYWKEGRRHRRQSWFSSFCPARGLGNMFDAT